MIVKILCEFNKFVFCFFFFTYLPDGFPICHFYVKKVCAVLETRRSFKKSIYFGQWVLFKNTFAIAENNDVTACYRNSDALYYSETLKLGITLFQK